ncbi:MAG: phosphatase PAP2 family protein [Chitinophagaceae bacterium]|nr:phosphatase PAP2 family protein [Chitinophagaceae bacterium]
MESLLQLDRELFTFINSTASSPSIDWLFKLLRNATTWIPLYAFILWYLYKYEKRFTLPFIFFSLLTFAITDFVSASILKELFARPRPCHDPSLVVRDLVGCGGKYGMPSSHASNHFGLASFWYFTIIMMNAKKWWWLWLWAFLICYAQVYVGKHYPGDVLVGAFFGTCIGILMALLFRSLILKTKSK